MVYESITQKAWRANGAGDRRHAKLRNRRVQEVLQRLEVNPTVELSEGFPLVCWQVSLWGIAAQISPESLVGELCQWWQVPGMAFPPQLNFRGPIAREDREAWIENLRSLLQLRGDPIGHVTPWVSFDQRVQIIASRVPGQPHLPWPVISPWLQRQAPARPGQRSKSRKYQGAENPALLVRLMCGAMILVRALRHLAAVEQATLGVTGLLVHTADVLEQSYGWLRPDSTTAPSVPDQHDPGQPLSGLMLFVREHVQIAGKAELPTIGPDVFSNFLEQKFERDDEQDFVEVILPEVLIKWISDAYQAAVGTAGPSRWLTQIGAIYAAHRRGNCHSLPSQMNAALLVRFFCPAPLPFDAKEFDWRKPKIKWRVGGRQLLLSAPLPAEQWRPADWDETEMQPQTRIVRAIQCLDACDDVAQLPQDRQAWLDEFRDCLAGISERKDLDRFTRLRLLEFIEGPALRDARDDQASIALLILELGCPYDIHRLFETLYQLSSDHPLSEVGEARKWVRRSVLAAAQRHICSKSQDEHRQATPRPPRHVAQQQRRLEQLRNLVARVIVISLRSTVADSRLIVVDLRKFRLRPLQSAGTGRRLHKMAIDQFPGQQNSASAVDVPSLQPSHCRAAVNDPNFLNVTLLADDIDYRHGEFLNLFEAPKSEVLKLMNELVTEPRYVMAVVVDVRRRRSPQKDVRRDSCFQDQIAFNCGLPFCVRATVSEFDGRVGDWRAVPIWSPREPGRFEIHTQKLGRSGMHLSQRRLPGDIAPLEVRRLWDHSRGIWSLVLKHPRGLGIPDTDWNVELWNADLSWAFRRGPADPTVREFRLATVSATWDTGPTTGVWRPLDQDLLHLLLHGLYFDSKEGREDLAIMTLVSTCVSLPTGGDAWRFSVGPGENYLLSPADLHSDAAEALTQKIEDAVREFGTAIGLLVTFTPRELDGRMRLALYGDAVRGEMALRRYPEIATPFDTRNLNWKHLFRSQENPIAQKTRGGSWHYRVNSGLPRPFPRAVPVNLAKAPPREPLPGKAIKQQFTVTKWNPRLGFVDGEILMLDTLQVPPQEWNSFFEFWLGLQRGSRLELDKVIGSVASQGPGHVPCLTRVGVSVLVEAESLTLDHLSAELDPNAARGRVGTVVKISSDSSFHAEVPGAVVPEGCVDCDTCTGILFKLPKMKSSNGTLCEVLWGGHTITRMETLDVRNLPSFRRYIRPGSLVVARRTAGGWSIEIKPRSLILRALWRLERSASLEGLTYLGAIQYEGRDCALAEVRPGLLSLVPRPARLPLYFATCGSSNGNEGGLRPEVRVETRFEPGPNARPPFRAVLAVSGKFLVGHTPTRTGRGDQLISRIDYRLFQLDNDLVDVKRQFILSAAPIRAYAPQRQRSIQHEEVDWSKLLERYFQNPETLIGAFNGTTVTLKDLRIPSEPDGGKWKDRVSVVEREHILDHRYATNAHFRLFRNSDGQVHGSFQRVPALNINEYFDGLHISDDEKFQRLGQPLYYVGRIVGEEGQPIHHFEWGYGQTLQIDESQLRYNSNPFSSAKLILFHGDSITGVKFSVEDGKKILDFQEIHISHSTGRSLYLQRSIYRIVHVLQIRLVQDRLEVVTIEGFDRDQMDRERMSHFDLRNARLDAASVERLLLRFHEDGSDTEKNANNITCMIYGRFDTDTYERSLGREVVFQHVRLSFKPSGIGQPLDPRGERVFMTARSIETTQSDIGLKTIPLKGIRKEDADSQFADSMCLRRQFSVREDLLSRIYDDQTTGPDYFAGQVVLLQVSRDIEKDRPVLKLKTVPPRKIDHLPTAIAAAGGLLFATVGETDNGLRLELRPGIFVSISTTYLADTPNDLGEGDVVQIETAGSSRELRFRITRAAFRDDRYVPHTPRAVVAFPKNDLAMPKLRVSAEVRTPAFWERWRFTIGGLPNLTPSGGNYIRSRREWNPPNSEFFTDLMAVPHPKIVHLGRGADGRPRISPATYVGYAGRLVLEDDGRNVRCELLYRRDNASDESPRADWMTLSFADASIKSIARRCHSEKWQYHDLRTFTWSGTEDVERRQVGNHDATHGPVFFEVDSGQPRLRYSRARFLDFGFPIDELLHVLRSRPKRVAEFTVAGVSDQSGLWLELTPGRLVELPARRVIARVPQREQSLANLDWNAFAPGDLIRLSLSTNDPLVPDSVVLTAWLPGPRRAFEGKATWLPVHERNSEEGSLRVGAGDFQLTLPVPEPNNYGETVILSSENRIRTVGNDLPRPGDCVLLGLNERNEPVVLGFSEYQPAMDRDYPDWSIDPLRQEFASRTALRGLITAAGGAVPVTVETVVEKSRVMYFSRRNQRETWLGLHEGTLSQARLLGGLPDDVHVLVRIGAALLKVRLDRLISGLPPKNCRAAAEVLRNQNRSFWVWREPNGELLSGLSGETSSAEITASAIAVCDGIDVLLGMICQSNHSQSLYWLPGEHVTWSKLTADQLRLIFVETKRRKSFRAFRMETTGCISLVDVPDIKTEFQRLTVGNEVAVQQLPDVPLVYEEADLKRVLVETVGSKIILECDLYGGAEVTPAAEIILRDRRVVRVVPWGKRRFKLDLPVKLVIKPEVSTNAVPNAESLSVAEQNAMSDAELDNLLRFLHNCDRHEQPVSLQALLQTARTWRFRLPNRPEVQAEVGLRAVLVLHQKSLFSEKDLSDQLGLPVAECKQLAKKLKGDARFIAQELGCRALRSVHIEALARFWRGDPDACGYRHDLWKRLNEYLCKQLDHPNDCDATVIQAIRSFWEAVRLRDPEVMGRTHLDILADALMACTGEYSNLSELYSDRRAESLCAPVTHALITVLRTLPEPISGMQLSLQDSHHRLLSQALNTILASEVDVTLLRPTYRKFRNI